MSFVMALDDGNPLPPLARGIYVSIFSNKRVALTHSARVPRTMVAQGHYLHIVKGCAERALENEKL